MKARIAVLPGDGIGKEVTPQAVRALRVVEDHFGHQFELVDGHAGADAIERGLGSAYPSQTIDLCVSSDAVLFGATGLSTGFRSTGLNLRHLLDLRINLRPFWVLPSLAGITPFKQEIIQDTNVLVIRELIHGIGMDKSAARSASGEPPQRSALETDAWAEPDIAAVLHAAYRLAASRRGRLHFAFQDNVMLTSQLWRAVAEEIAAQYPSVETTHLYPDACAMELLRSPTQFDVVVFDNLYMGGMINNMGGVFMGSVGMCPSAELRLDEGELHTPAFGLYQPIHGSGPKRAGQGIVNPIGAILSAAMLLRYSLGLDNEALVVETAVAETLKTHRTYDVMQPGLTQVNTEQMGEAIAAAIRPPSSE